MEQYWDTKIISAMNERLDAEEPVGEGLKEEIRPETSEQPDLNQPLIVINGERVPFGERSILDDRLIVTVPKTFHEMTPEMASQKYPSEHRPKLILTNGENTVNLSFNHTADTIKADEFDGLMEEMSKILKQTQKIIEWIEQGVRELGEKKVGYFEFVTPVINANLYNLFFFAELEGTLLLVTFNCLNQEKEAWRPVAKSMLDSIRFVKEG
ncbi:hypothetical protein LBW89_18430 [Paenibacillus sp. alder61]|uniref:DUF1795 domain-containing protein n=1 Tax=Paenibacillus faecis TaxID=862114 RepID=A0A5D0CL27_9BACL|nr:MULTISPECIES: hypothetical protein [Paenibacillus]MCA1294992.1 hypothetical protein [Paenibacillus sp. alder61]TYA10743.1 hypothetical protein FRY98_23455 [Paenibacillus faecis]